MDKGFVKLENFQSSRHKFKYVYILTPAGLAQKIILTGRFLKRKMQEFEALKAEIEGLEDELVDREMYTSSEVSKPHVRDTR